MKEKNNEKLLGVQGILPFTHAKFQIYLKLVEDEAQIFSVFDFKKTEPIESLISIMRQALDQW